MLKKSLIALAIAAASTSAFAAINTTETKSVSLEGNALNTVITTQNITVMLGAEYAVGDLITYTFTGVNIDTATVPSSISFGAADPWAGRADLPAPAPKKNLNGMTLGLLNTTATTATYRVTELSTVPESGTLTTPGLPFTTVNQTVTLKDLKLKAATFSGEASVVYSARTAADQVLDSSAKNSAVLLEGVNQFVAGVNGDGFTAVIDVNEQRLQFTGGSVVDHVTLKLTNKVVDLNPADLTETTYTVYGNFGFLDTDPETAGIQPKAGAVLFKNGATAPDKLTITAESIVGEWTTAPALNPELILDLKGDVADFSNDPIATQDFTATVGVKYTANTKTATADVNSNFNAGSWILNGASVHVPFMPFRDGYSPIVNVSNTSTQDGDIEVVVYAADNAWAAPKSYMLTVPAKAQAQTNITKALSAAGIKGDVAFDIIVNAPKENIEVSALYYNAGDRAVMNTTKK
jgi:hypothetical protein